MARLSMSKALPFQGHLEELRRRLLVVVGAAVLLSVFGYWAYPKVYSFIGSIVGEKLFLSKVYEGFFIRLKVGVLVGVFLTIPIFLYQAFAYILPALERREKMMLSALLVSSLGLFIGGVAASIRVVLPLSIRVLRSSSFNPDDVSRIISYDSFVMFVFQFAVAFGACLQFPIVIMILLYYKIVSTAMLIRFSRYFVVVALLVAGILTPTPDMISQVMLAVPLIALYFLCISIAKILRWS